MTDSEKALFIAFARCSTRYVEFGCGGSTALAASLVRDHILAIDSDPNWLERVANYCREATTRVQPELFHADIGSVTTHGRPSGWPRGHYESYDKWPNYHESVWSINSALNADCYLVDGRFRVACFLQILLRVTRPIPILFHDFDGRPSYYAILPFVKEIARVEKLSVFIRDENLNVVLAQKCLEDHRYDPQ